MLEIAGKVLMQSLAKLPFNCLTPSHYRTRRLTMITDVWRFGMLIREVFMNGQSILYSDYSGAQRGAQYLSRYIMRGGHPNRLTNCREEFWHLMLVIFNVNYKERIAMHQVMEEIETNLWTGEPKEQPSYSRWNKKEWM